MATCDKQVLHTIRAGDTLYHLAQRYDTTVRAIIATNPRLDPYNLQIGSQLTICAGSNYMSTPETPVPPIGTIPPITIPTTPTPPIGSLTCEQRIAMMQNAWVDFKSSLEASLQNMDAIFGINQ